MWGDARIEAEDIALGQPNLRKHHLILMRERQRGWRLGRRAGAVPVWYQRVVSVYTLHVP